MRKIKILALASLFSINLKAQETTLTVFDQVLFYDGYAGVVTEPVTEGIIRHRNDLFAKKLSSEDLLSIGTTLNMSVTIKAACDNYDRIGSVNLVFAPKGDSTYDVSTVQRIELGRFITPFMNKNIQPDEVPYDFTIDNIANILKDEATNELYDFWIELQVFGVPYAANTEVSGCAGRNDVFYGTLKFTTNTEMISSNDYLMPLNFQNNLNDYQAGASDALGVTKRTITLNVPANLANAKLYLITSNHGANSGGEEYNRRFHYIYFDGMMVLSYKPGETSCEPYRIYNTQGNGIYGANPKTDAQWQSFSNWCPGAKIPIREIDLGYLNAGEHTFKIDVPTAVFANNEGNFPVSLYLQGTRDNVGIDVVENRKIEIFPNPSKGKFEIIDDNISEKEIKITDFFGKEIAINKAIISNNKIEIDSKTLANGIYFISIASENNQILKKIIISH